MNNVTVIFNLKTFEESLDVLAILQNIQKPSELVSLLKRRHEQLLFFYL